MAELYMALECLVRRVPALQADHSIQAACESKDTAKLLEVWQRLLVHTSTTLAAASCLKGQLLSLVSLLVDAVESDKSAGLDFTHAAVVTAVLRMLEFNPDITRLLQRLFRHIDCPLVMLISQQQQQLDTAAAAAAAAEQELLALSTLRALQLNPRLGMSFRGALWFKLLSHALPVVRWVAVRGIAMLLGLSDALQQRLMEAQLTAEQLVEAHMRWDEERTAVALQLSYWWHPCPAGAPCCSSSHAITDPSSSIQTNQQQQQKLPPGRGFVRVCDLEIPARSDDAVSSSCSSGGTSSTGTGAAGLLSWGRLVQTPSMTAALESAALALCQGSPIVVEGPAGCGKTTLIRALAAATGNDRTALWLHLDDQQDAKSLLGSYSCSAVPGEFVWQMGPLARAVAEGRWVVIEGVDTAPADVLAALLPLLESGVLHIPSRGQVLTAAPGFQVLGTVTTTPSTSSAAAGGAVAGVAASAAADVLGGSWSKVLLDAPTEAEQLAVLQGLYPDLAPLLPVAQATVKLVQLAGGHGAAAAAVGAASWPQQAAAAALKTAGLRQGELSLSLGRQFSTRDLIKWCGRMVAGYGPMLLRTLKQGTLTAAATPAGKKSKSSKSKKAAPAASATAVMVDLARLDERLKFACFTEAADLFTGLVSKHEVKLRLLAALAVLWGLAGPAAVAEQYEELAKPHMHLGANELQVGRAVLPLHHSQPSTATAATAGLGCFSPTGLALRVMERVGVCLSRGEAVLLVGETGTGKTTTLSHLARTVGANLVALNMSQQTDSSDLLGGYKPVGVGEALLPLLEPFGELLRKTWKKGNNEEFLSRTVKYAQRKKWSHLLTAYKTAIAKLQLDQPACAGSSRQPQQPPQQQQQQQQGDQSVQDSAAAVAAVATDASPAIAAGGGGRGKAGSKGKAVAAAVGSKPSKKRKVSASAAGTTAAGGAEQNATAAAAAVPGSKTPAVRSSSSSSPLYPQLVQEWRRFAADVEAAERASTAAEGGFAFAFVEGALVKALKHGWWLLLDEINLAPPEVLERIAGILEAHPLASNDSANPAAAATGEDASTGLLLVERGDVSVVARHPGFRLVAAMNPATDAGKRDLPPQLRSRFTEFWVGEPRSRSDLGQLVGGYLAAAGPSPPVEPVVDLYLAAKTAAESRLTDGAGQRPAYSLRSLCRALDYARRAAAAYGLTRALWDGFSMSFLTQLTPESGARLQSIMVKHLLPGGPKSLKTLMRAPPSPGESHVLFEQFWLECGPLPLPALGTDDDGSSRRFVLTPSVRQQLCNLARCVLAHKHPILLQGPTSSGKTSLVAYLAAQTGHKCVRINNHQHTDLQEYLGSWVPDEQGRLVFREGALVTALRAGHWVVLDELNLAPTEVLEALNRLLDDNRELFVPELQEVVRPHPHFMLFATQNPPGAYAGRKALSRAFRGRFLELHVEELPDHELADILHQRCGIAPSYASKMVTVMRELQRRRQRSNVFAGRHGFITPRDLFRWAERGAVGYESLAVDGFMVLGERLRSAEERAEVAQVLQQVLRVPLDMEQVYQQVGAEPQQRLAEALAAAEAATAEGAAAAAASDCAAAAAAEEAAAIKAALSGMVWTRSMKRLYTLVDRCLRHQEPVLLVGETGTGKTSVCQLLALMRHTHLHVLNCNQHTETSDFLGGFRPTRTRDRDLAQFRSVAQDLLSGPAWQLAQHTVPPQLAAAAAEAASPVEVEQALQATLSHVTAVTAVLKAAVQLHQQQQAAADPAAAAAVSAAAASPEQLQAELERLAAGVSALRAAAAAARAPFGWEDGPLVVAMRRGELLLVDELNLAEDAVLERLNSVLEPGRSLTLAEKGGAGAELVVGAPGFMVLATMNPGGDYGKKELSPALSNRFTQVWVPAITDDAELLAILESRLAASSIRSTISRNLLEFWHLYVAQAPVAARGGLSVRDLLAWVGFINATAPQLGALEAYAHGAYLTLLDGLGLGLGIPANLVAALRQKCRKLLERQLAATAAHEPQQQQLVLSRGAAAAAVAQAAGELQTDVGGAVDVLTDDGRWGIPPFFVERGPAEGASAAAAADSSSGPRFNWQAPTTCRNAFRLLRAMQLGRAVLLEGSPGVGKTSLVTALARAAAARLVRINLSEHTDMIDLLGADLPAPGGAAGQFAWCDGPLLAAVKAGHWVLLDELNLAGQSVLEGLNGLLDHRQALFVPELGQSFKAHPRFRLFAAQNPLQEGGGRKGLPKSFLNRFTRVAVELLRPQDLRSIAMALHPELPAGLIGRMVDLLTVMQDASNIPSSSSNDSSVGGRAGAPFAVAGGPWEFNLRDLLRWCELVCMLTQQQHSTANGLAAAETDAMEVDSTPHQQQFAPGGSSSSSSITPVLSAAQLDAAAEHFAGVLFTQRLRTAADRQRLQTLFQQVWGRPMKAPSSLAVAPAAHTTSSSSSSSSSSDNSSSATGIISSPAVVVLPHELQVGLARIPRATVTAAAATDVHPSVAAAAVNSQPQELLLPSHQAPLLESALSALSAGWMVLLVGPGGSGKTSLARLASQLVGVGLQELALTQGTDTSDLLGSFEQVEPARKVQELAGAAQQLVTAATNDLLLMGAAATQQQQQQQRQQYLQVACELHEAWGSYSQVAAAAAGAARQQQQQDDEAAAAASGQQSISDTVRQLKRLHHVLQRLNNLHNQLQQQYNSQLQQVQQQAADLLHSAVTLLQQLESPEGASTAGRFEWVDGSLTRAIQNGSWVLLDNANLVNPTVLDRLNGLLEPNGVLQLDEAGGSGSSGGGRVVKPHPGFRLILAYDPKHGEVSRAMRNRGVELYLLPPIPAAVAAGKAAAGQEPAAAAAMAAATEELEQGLPRLPDPSTLNPTWALSGQPDLETLLASTGVTGSTVLAAMATAHTQMAASCTAAHRKTPGLREAKTWAQTTRVLLQQGRCLAAALYHGWVHVYMRGFAATGGLAAEGQSAFLGLCEALQLQPPAGAVQYDTVLPVQAVQHTTTPAAAAAAAEDTDTDMLDLDSEQQHQQQSLVLGTAWPNQLLRPCQWPVWVGVTDLAQQSAVAAAARNASLPVWLLAQALAAELQAAAAVDGSDSSTAVAAANELLQRLPAGQQVLLPIELLTHQQQQISSSSSSIHVLQLLPELSLRAAAACLCKAAAAAVGAGSSKLQQLWLQQQLAQVAAAATASGSRSGRSLGLSQLLLQQLVPMVAQQPWHSNMQQLLLQKSQSVRLQSPEQPQQQLAALLPLLQQAACHAAVAAAAGGAAAAAAAAAGDASPYQQSVWRSSHPLERARSEAPHPAIDGLYPCLAAVAAFEGAALQLVLQHLQGDSSSSSQITNIGKGQGQQEIWQIAGVIRRLQLARYSVWEAVHGPLHQHYSANVVGSSSSDDIASPAAAAAVQPERLAWTWSQLSKAVQQLLYYCPELAVGESAARWQYLNDQMAAALQLDAAAPKPLLWQFAGHPQLPPSRSLLAAQQKAEVLARALAAGNGLGFRVDGRGQPQGLAAAGIDWQQLLQQAVQAVQEQQQHDERNAVAARTAAAAGDDSAAQQQQGDAMVAVTPGFTDITSVLDGGDLGPGGGAALRERLAAAAAATLCCDVGFRRSVTQGLALLSFLPHMQVLNQQQQQQQQHKGGGCTAADSAVTVKATDLVSVPLVLQQQATSVLLPLLTQLLAAPQPQQHEAAGAAAVTAALKQWQKQQQHKPGALTTTTATGSNSGYGELLLLPARAMVSAAARHMQMDLQQLMHTACLQEEGQINAAALAWLLAAAAAGARGITTSNSNSRPAAAGRGTLVLPVLPKQQLLQLQHRLNSYLATAGAASCNRTAAALVPLQQLSWLVSNMLDESQQLPAQQLLQQVLPGLLHDAWFSWQLGLWTGDTTAVQGSAANSVQRSPGFSGGSGSDSAGFSFLRGLGISARVNTTPLSLHVASRTAAVLQICSVGACDGTSKAARLQQLALAAQQLQQAGSSSVQQQQQMCNLGLLLSQILLAHLSSFSSESDAVALQHLAQQLLAWCGSSSTSNNSSSSSSARLARPEAVRPWLADLADVISRSRHSTLKAVSQQLLLPCAEAILLGSNTSNTRQQQQEQQAGNSWYTALGVQGWAWLLLGCARLQLVCPPSGVDPAGRCNAKAAALHAWVTQQLDPAIQVSRMFQQLPGGADESSTLQVLLQQRAGLADRLNKLSSRCVPRPDPPQYLHLQQEVAAFTRGLADPQRLLAIGQVLRQSSTAGSTGGATAAAATAVHEAQMWDGSAAAWAERMQSSFPDYVDILQPVLLALLEVRHGLVLLVAASQAAQQAVQVDTVVSNSVSYSVSNSVAVTGSSSSSEQLIALTAGLLSFPPALAVVTAAAAGSSSSSSNRLIALPASTLADPCWQKVTGALIKQQQGSGGTQQQQQQQQQQPAAAAAVHSELADFAWQLRTVHAALLIAVQSQLAAGGSVASTSTAAAAAAAEGEGSGLRTVESLLQQLLGVWQSVKLYEAQAAEEAAQLFKHKTQTSTFQTEEEEAEADYKAQFPDHFAAFADIAPDESDPDAHLHQQQQDMDLDAAAAAGDEDAPVDAAAAVTAAQAKSAAAKSLLEGQLLQDVVTLHQQLYTALAARKLQHQLTVSTAAAAAAGEAVRTPHQQQQLLAVDDSAREEAFKLCYNLGQQLVAAQQCLLPATLDQIVQPGSIMALALQHRSLSAAAAATAAAAAAGQQQQQLDMQQPFPEEAALMQQPLADMSHRLTDLLEEWPEHPLLLQLLAIVERMLGLPLTAPLKQALTGLELLLARAQVWEETAAKHVSLKAQLAAIAGLATRWRKLELASWKGLLGRVRKRHAAGAYRTWYHLYQVLMMGGPAGDDAAAAAAEEDGSSSSSTDTSEAAYRRTAALVEAFIQTSTVGEYAARLQMLHSFACQLAAAAAVADADASAGSSNSNSSARVASMLWNVLSYYSQFVPAVSAAIDAGLGPLSKELSDFVKLAKWEDRGYYASKISTEKAQRQLHRLSRRAEDCLKQPAAAVLATASQAMGLGQVTAPKAAMKAAAAAGRAAGKAAKQAAAAEAAAAAGSDAAATAAGVDPQQLQQQQQQKEREAMAAAAAQVDPALLAELDAADLGIQGCSDQFGSGEAATSSLDSFAAAALAAAGLQPAGSAAIAAAAAASGKSSKAKKAAKTAAANQVDLLTAPLAEAVQQLQQLEQPAWEQLSSAVLKAAAAAGGGDVAQQNSSSAGNGSSSSSSSYVARLPKLAARMVKVLAPAPLAAAPAVAAAAVQQSVDGSTGANTQQQQQQQQYDQLVAAVPALQLDDLAATAASRALALSSDITKGARLRKKKALTDLLHALSDAGFSKRSSDVPAGDRDAAAWFGHHQPCLVASLLLQPIQQAILQHAAPATAVAAAGGAATYNQHVQLASVCWAKSDSYYFKSIARLQRLEAAAKAPHRDLARHEVLAAVAYSHHQMCLMRQQRQLLGELAGSYTHLLQATLWLQEVTAGSSSSEIVSACQPLPQQQSALDLLSTARHQLNSLSYELSGAKQLMLAVIPMQQSSGQPPHVWKASSSAAAKITCYITVADRCKAAVDAQWGRVNLAGCPVVTNAAVAAVTDAVAELQQLQQDIAAATADIAAAVRAAAGDTAAADFQDDTFGSSSDKAVVCRIVPAWDRALDALAAAVQHVIDCQQQQQPGTSTVDQQEQQQQFGSCLDDLVSQALLAAQALHNSSSIQQQQQQQADANADTSATAAAAAAGCGGVVGWTSQAAHALKPARLAGLAKSVRTLLSLLPQQQQQQHSEAATSAAAAMMAQAAAVLPLLQLLLCGLQRSACELLLLHKSLAKLCYICSSIFCSLVCEGYCMPEGEEGEAAAGAGEGELQWQDAAGTGMGEGTGKKDVSDQIQNEDQLLGAQQKDQQQQQQEEQQQQQGEDDRADGIEMDADFEGSLHDIDDRKQQQQQGDESEESQEGDDDRIDQQMGEVGENEERVDERLWGDNDDEPQDKEQQQQQGKDEVDRQQQLSVEDTSNLEYAGGGEDDQQQQQQQDQKQQQQQQRKGAEDQAGPDKQQHDSEAEEEEQQPGEGENEQQPGPDIDDAYQQQHKPGLEQQEQELQLSDDLNLDGMDEDGPDGPEQQQQQGEEDTQQQQQQQQQQQEGEEAAGAGGDEEQQQQQQGEEGGEGTDEQQQQQQQHDQEGGEEAVDDGPDAAAAAAQEQQQQQDEADADADGSKRAAPPEEPQQQQDEQQQQEDEDLEAVAAAGAGEEDEQAPEEIPQAGPQGVASAAAAPQAQAQGAADAQQQQQDEQQQQQHADVAQPMDWEDQQAQDAAQQAQQTQLGAAGATDLGQIAPLQQQGGTQQQQHQAGQQQRRQRQQQQPELNPFRNLGDALERWKADLAVQHEAVQQEEDQEAAAAAAHDATADLGEPPIADEYQFLGQHEQQQEGTTQALAPATEEQAAQQGQEAGMQQQQQQGQEDEQPQQEQGQQQDDQDLAAAADMDTDAAAAPEADAADDEKIATGRPPKVWSGSQKKPGQQQQQQDKEQQQQQPGPDAADAAAAEEQQQREAAEAAAQQRQQLLDAAAAPAAAADADQAASLVAAKLATTQLDEDEGTGLEAEEASMRATRLPADQAAALRAELDARLRDAAAAAAAGGRGPDSAGPDGDQAAAYGREMWGHCEALVSGLAGELTEQLRLILEPSLASRLGGEYRSGKRLNMKRVIGYIASQFRRDKIWMRRSRPDKRRYQVVVAVDDSRSMAENGAGCFALEALALLCKAMSRLEVGELGVVSYGGGGGVQPLQPLEVPFTDAAGPAIMSALRFDQDNTITDRPMLQLVEAVQHLLDVARHRVASQASGSSSSNLRQLLLVLGDGRFHEKEALLGAVRRLVEVQGVCPVFIALDTAASTGSGNSAAAAGGAGSSSAGAAARPGSSGSGGAGGGGKGSSLLDMQSVKFVDGKPVFERYLDSFPFPYYIVLRDIAALPATLADLLRQWFELNASSS